ncbi:MAG: endonuclease III [Kiritimatiellae bacterium]|nr:endonuclease III [Kiritimatiellia bacterium]
MKISDLPTVTKILKKEFDKKQAPVVDLVKAQTNDPFKILVATILSARTKDDTTAAACKRLFSKVNNHSDLNKLTVIQIEKLIFPVGFYHNKAKYLKELPASLNTLFDGNIPDTIDELCQLPGVGRKTANLVVTMAFDKPAMCVDIHVHRISNRFGLLKTATPLETEMRLRKILPDKYWMTWNSYLVSFGQTVCSPINPKCNQCPISDYCSRINVKTKHAIM